jgi:hypothetical protein
MRMALKMTRMRVSIQWEWKMKLNWWLLSLSAPSVARSFQRDFSSEMRIFSIALGEAIYV